MQSIQLSHEELLLLLGLTRLPLPLALGEQPTAGYSDETLGAALTGAVGSLTARGLLAPPVSVAAAPAVLPELQALLAASALADCCAILAVRCGERETATHYTCYQQVLVAHSSPADRVHRLERLPATLALPDLLLAQIGPQPADAALPAFTLPGAALNLALDAASVGQADPARLVLQQAGVAAPVAASFIAAAGTVVVRYALVSLHGLHSAAAQTGSCMVVRGQSATWYVTAADAQTPMVTVEPVDAAQLLARLATQLRGLA